MKTDVTLLLIRCPSGQEIRVAIETANDRSRVLLDSRVKLQEDDTLWLDGYIRTLLQEGGAKNVFQLSGSKDQRNAAGRAHLSGSAYN